MALLDETDVTLGRKIGISRQAVHAKRTGRTSITADDMAAIGMALGVDPSLLMGPPHEAVAWMAEHKPEVLDDVLAGKAGPSRCTYEAASQLNRSLSGAKLLARCPPSGLRAAA